VLNSLLDFQDLTEELEGELGGSFAKLVLALMKLPEEYIVECVHDSIAVRFRDITSILYPSWHMLSHRKRGVNLNKHCLTRHACAIYNNLQSPRHVS